MNQKGADAIMGGIELWSLIPQEDAVPIWSLAICIVTALDAQ